VYMVLIGKSDGKRLRGRPRRKREDNDAWKHKTEKKGRIILK